MGRFMSRDPMTEFSAYDQQTKNKSFSQKQKSLMLFHSPTDYLINVNDNINKQDNLGLYTVNSCTIVLFYGHDDHAFFKTVKAKKSSGTTAVTCKSDKVFALPLDGLIPGAVHSNGRLVVFGPYSDTQQKLDELDGVYKMSADSLLQQNAAAMKAYAQTLCGESHCCKKVKLEQKCVGGGGLQGIQDCLRFYGAPGLPTTIDCKEGSK